MMLLGMLPVILRVYVLAFWGSKRKMGKQRPQTIADYAAIALCPSLIVLLISSLVYFLVLCIYRGQYSGRIGYIWFMFILGAVGIARLSIEESRKYAIGYAAVLGIATFFVLSRFMVVQGPAAAASPILNAAMIALVWFLADRITFDCTLIDEGQDASGRGLLDGLTDDAATVEQKSGSASEQEPGQTPGQAPKRRRAHQPGRTVLWLAAAALPIFGLGQSMLPQDSRWQQSAISALAIYLFATLSLLVATSFLGVRRYLRQRGVDMPSNVSAAWLAGGVAMTAIMLSVCFLLPQPGKLLAKVDMPEAIPSPDWLKPSKYGWGKETAKPSPDNAGAASTPTPEKDAQGNAPPPEATGPSGEKSSGQGGGQKPGDKSGPGDKGSKAESGQTSGEKSAGKKSSGEKSSGGGDEGKKAEGSQSKSQPNAAEKSSDNAPQPEGPKSQNSSDSEPAKPSQDDKQSGEQPAGDDGKKSEEAQAPNKSENTDQSDQSKGEKSSENNQSDAEPSKNKKSDAEKSDVGKSQSADAAPKPEPPADTSSWLDGLMPSLGSLFRAVIYLVLIGVLIAFAWIQRHEIARMWQAFLNWLHGHRIATAKTEDVDLRSLDQAIPRPFSSFRNPLGTRTEPREAIIVTYQAAEAWWREKGQGRNPDETPHEYSRRLQTERKSDQEAMVRLTDAYNRVVYGDQSVQPTDLNVAATIWKSFAQS